MERITFSEPYIQKNTIEKEIGVNLMLGEDCRFTFNTDLNTDPSQENYFEMNFINIDFPENSIYYQCSFPSLKTKNEGVCDLEVYYYQKGNYKFSEYQSLKVNNSSTINNTTLS